MMIEDDEDRTNEVRLMKMNIEIEREGRLKYIVLKKKKIEGCK